MSSSAVFILDLKGKVIVNVMKSTAKFLPCLRNSSFVFPGLDIQKLPWRCGHECHRQVPASCAGVRGRKFICSHYCYGGRYLRLHQAQQSVQYLSTVGAYGLRARDFKHVMFVQLAHKKVVSLTICQLLRPLARMPMWRLFLFSCTNWWR